MICSQCGSLLSEGSDLCPNCGTSEQNIPAFGQYTDSCDIVFESESEEDLSPITFSITEAEASVKMAPDAHPATEPSSEVSTGTPVRSNAHRSASPVSVIAKVVLSIIFPLLLFGFILVTTVLIVVRPESAFDVVKRADVTWILEETEIGDIIVNEINASELVYINIDVDSLNRFIKRENVSAQVGRMAEKYVRAIAEADYDYYLNLDDILGFVRAVTPDIHDEFGVSLSETDYNVIADSINRYVDLSDFSVGKIFDDADFDAALPFMLLSIYPLIILTLLCVLVMFDIFLLHRKRIRNAFVCVGVPIALSGLVCLIAGLLLGPYSVLFDNSALYGIIKLIIGVVDHLFLPAMIYMAVGLVSVVTFVIMNRVRTQFMLIDYKKTSKHLWLITGLVANGSIFIICSVLSLIFYLNMPQ